MPDVIAHFRATIERTFTTPVTVQRLIRARTADGGWTEGTAPAGTFYARLENNRRLSEERVLAGQVQDRVYYRLHTPLSVGTSLSTATIDRYNPDGAYLTPSDRLVINGHTYELTDLPDPDTDAPARVLTIWRNQATP
jgi:predicted 2-oxoglutarate/Fe(II)-dependent dioxygenase YbiX